MAKTKQEILQQLKKDYEAACNAYLVELLNLWELDSYYGYWIGDEVGGVYDYADGTIDINMDDIIYCVEHELPREKFDEWSQYVCDAAEFNMHTPNLKAFISGCPRVPQETFDRLRQLKADLNQAVEEAKAKALNGVF